MSKAKAVVHNEYFRTVLLGGRKSCPSCHSRLDCGEKVWSWGEYQRVTWYTVQHFCKACWPGVAEKLANHAFHCRCTFQLVGYGGEHLPAWLSLDTACCLTAPNR